MKNYIRTLLTGCHRATRAWHPVRLLERHERSDGDLCGLRNLRQPRSRHRSTVPAVGEVHRRHEGGRRQDDDHRHRRRRHRDRRLRLQRHRRRSMVLRQPEGRQDRHHVPIQGHAQGRVRRQGRRRRSDHERRRLSSSPPPRFRRPRACTPPTSTVCAHRGWSVPTAARSACSSTAASAAATSSRPSCSS